MGKNLNMRWFFSAILKRITHVFFLKFFLLITAHAPPYFIFIESNDDQIPGDYDGEGAIGIEFQNVYRDGFSFLSLQGIDINMFAFRREAPKKRIVCLDLWEGEDELFPVRKKINIFA